MIQDSKPALLIDAVSTRRILGVDIHAVTMEQVLPICDDVIRSKGSLMIGVVNAAKIVNMGRQPLLRESVASSDLVLADGMAVVWASRILRQPLPERIAGIDLFERLLQLADQRGHTVYLLGATRDVLDRVVCRIRMRYPGARIAGAYDGYFSDDEADKVAAEIRLAKPDMLFLGMTSPKKEIFLGQWGPSLNVPVCHGVGGSFDVMAGKVRRAPRLWQRLGLEWLFRVVQEPGRMWRRYLVTNSIFAWMLLKEWLIPTDQESQVVRGKVANRGYTGDGNDSCPS